MASWWWQKACQLSRLLADEAQVDGQENPLPVFGVARIDQVGQNHLTLWNYRRVLPARAGSRCMNQCGVPMTSWVATVLKPKRWYSVTFSTLSVSR